MSGMVLRAMLRRMTNSAVWAIVMVLAPLSSMSTASTGSEIASDRKCATCAAGALASQKCKTPNGSPLRSTPRRLAINSGSIQLLPCVALMITASTTPEDLTASQSIVPSQWLISRIIGSPPGTLAGARGAVGLALGAAGSCGHGSSQIRRRRVCSQGGGPHGTENLRDQSRGAGALHDARQGSGRRCRARSGPGFSRQTQGTEQCGQSDPAP